MSLLVCMLDCTLNFKNLNLRSFKRTVYILSINSNRGRLLVESGDEEKK